MLGTFLWDTAYTILSTVFAECEDLADWCEDRFAGYCYDPYVESTCCARCAQVKTNDASTYICSI